MNVGSTSVDHPPALQAGFYCGVYGERRGIASLVRDMRDVIGGPAFTLMGVPRCKQRAGAAAPARIFTWLAQRTDCLFVGGPVRSTKPSAGIPSADCVPSVVEAAITVCDIAKRRVQLVNGVDKSLFGCSGRRKVAGMI